MGHLVGKDKYRELGRKLDNLTCRAPWNDRLFNILRELYTTEEADIAVRMPYGLSNLDKIQKITRYDRERLRKILESLSSRGLLLDIWINGEYKYMLSPMVVGIFEFTMMRTGDNLNTKEWARLFNEYLHGDNSFYAANFGSYKKVSPLRALPHEDAIDSSEYVEVLDYEKASAILEQAQSCAVGICSCRHEKLHSGQKKCDVPLELCTSLNGATDYMIRHGFAKSVDKSEVMENLSRAKELGLVLCADNVKKDVSFICFCCGCCCNVLLGVSRFGFPETVVTSNFIARVDSETCAACGTCAEACPVSAIKTDTEGNPKIDEALCIGCGVCGLKCSTDAMKLVKRKQRVLHPENTFERVILQSLERGTLQNLLFTDPGRITHKFMRAFVGGFLRIPPVKKALMADNLRSSFLSFMQRGA
jgi:Pyruvate/2-oxoacid:ferredoxin oxidoreductase delta subunit